MFDNLRAKAKKEYRQEKAKLAVMSREDRRWYIWAYYKVHILLGAAALLLIGYCVNIFLINPPKAYYITFALYGEYIPTEVAQQFRQNMADALDINQKKQQVMTFNFYYDAGNANLSAAMSQKYMSLVYVRQVDLVLADSDDFNTMAQNSEFLSLDQLLTPGQLKTLGDLILWQHQADDLNGHPYGLKMDGSQALYDSNLYSAGKVLSVCATSKNMDKILQTIEYFFPQITQQETAS